jgi:hypothetical protein
MLDDIGLCVRIEVQGHAAEHLKTGNTKLHRRHDDSDKCELREAD